MDELKARPFVDLVHPDDLETSLAKVAGLAHGVTLVSFENRFRRKGGSYVWMLWTATPSVATGLFYAAGHDITERKRAEAENAANQVDLQHMVDINGALLDASVDGIRLVDLEGRTMLANSVIERLARDVFRHAGDATLQESASLADRFVDPASYLATLARIAADPECSTKDDFELADERRAFQRHTGPVHDAAGKLFGRIIVIRESTAEREVARLKSELVATVSHELRTPLTGVLGFAELLLQRDLDDDFLDLQRFEAGGFTLTLDAFDLGGLLRHAVELFSSHSASHALVCDIEDETLEVAADRARIGQVVANLLSNAIKYSPAGGMVTVAATTRGDCTRVSVSDSGLGIPAAQQAQVFTKFFRVDSSDTRKIGGTGLGLALCHEIVTAHGGQIGFESTEGVGSTFWFELPSASVDLRGHTAQIMLDGRVARSRAA